MVTPQPLIPPGASRIELAGAMIKERQDAIRDGFFVPLFVTPQQPVKTATQVLQETDERNRATAPMTIRMHQEHFSRFLPRTLRMASEGGMFNDAPAGVQQRMDKIKLKYNSPIVASVQQNEGLAVLRMFEGLAPLAQISETAFDQVNVEEAASVVISASGVPQTVRATTAQKQKKKAAREEQQAMMTMAEAAPDMLKGMAAVTTANKR
jgi:hypothetical protein